MNIIRYELFGSEAAVSSLELQGGELILIFPDTTEGFIRIGARIYKLSSSRAEINPEELDDGIHAPHLFTSFGEYKIPKIQKNGKTIKLAAPEETDIYMNILRTKRLENTLISLEKHISSLQDKIEKTTIF